MQITPVKAVAVREYETDDYDFIVKSGLKGRFIYMYEDFTGDLIAIYKPEVLVKDEVLNPVG